MNIYSGNYRSAPTHKLVNLTFEYGDLERTKIVFYNSEVIIRERSIFVDIIYICTTYT